MAATRRPYTVHSPTQQCNRPATWLQQLNAHMQRQADSRRPCATLPTIARLSAACVIVFACLQANVIQAAALQQRLPNGLLANAEYYPSQKNKTAVLVLHGLLATHHFPTIQRLADELRDSGYGVLTPTLTLGINDRKTSLSCTALQLHTLEQNVAELSWWVDWLVDHGYHNVYLIGHSLGSVQILAYSLGKPNPAVRKLILTSLVPQGRLPGMDPLGESSQQAAARLARGDNSIGRYDLGFCHGNFTAPPNVYRSYHRWDENKVLAALHSTPTATAVILGGADHLFTPNNWIELLRTVTDHLTVLPNASHFFDGLDEFALFQQVHRELLTPSPQEPNRE